MNQLAQEIYTLNRAMDRIYKHAYKMSYAKYKMLNSCVEEMRMSDLSEQLQLESSAISTLASRAEKEQLVTRRFSLKDRRVVYIKLTKAGKKLVDKMAGDDEIEKEVNKILRLTLKNPNDMVDELNILNHQLLKWEKENLM